MLNNASLITSSQPFCHVDRAYSVMLTALILSC